MAFELAKIDPTSVPINLLNPRPGTKFGDRDHMDPWEVVKWIAIFRLILPERAVPPLRRPRREPRRPAAARGQGRPQRRDDGQLPHDARHHARARTARCSPTSGSTSPASPTTARTRGRTTARAGWTARRPTSSRTFLDTRRRTAERGGHRDPALGPGGAAALREEGRGAAAARRRAEPLAEAGRRSAPAMAFGDSMDDIEARLEELREPGLLRRMRHGQRAAGSARRARRQAGPAAVLEQLPRAGRPPARARGGGRRGDALGRRRRRVAAGVGDDDVHRRLEERLPRSRAPSRRCSSARATSRTSA